MQDHLLDPIYPVLVRSVPPKKSSIRCVGCASTHCVRLHYGAPSCHGCKAFFRRTVFGGRTYICNGSNTCNTSNEARNSCRACRINSCLRGGMNPKLVREERMRGSLESFPEDGSLSDTENDRIVRSIPSNNVQVCSDGYYGLVRFLCATEKEAELNRDPPGYVSPLGIDRYPIEWVCSRIMGTGDVYSQWSRAFVLHTDFVTDIPEYRSLNVNDQALLFKTNFPCFGWMTYTYKCHVNKLKHKGMPLGNGSYVPFSPEECALLEPIWEKTYATICRKLISEVVTAMEDLNITFEEYCLLKTMALFQIETGLSEEGAQCCLKFKQKLQEALSSQIASTFPYLSPVNKSTRILKLAMLLPTFTHIGHVESDMIRLVALPPPPEPFLNTSFIKLNEY